MDLGEESWVDGPVSPFMTVLAKYWLITVLGVQALGYMRILSPLQYFFENRESQKNERQDNLLSSHISC